MVLRPNQTKLKAYAVKVEGPKENLFAEAQVNKGVITMIDPDDIPNGALQVGKNIFVRFDRTLRRYGGVLLTPPKPDGLTVLGLHSFITKAGSAFTYRFTRESIYSRQASTWDVLTGTALLGSNFDRIQLVNILDRAIFANNGANKIQLIDHNAETYANLGNAQEYRYITGFFNRAVGAALRGTSEVRVGWSADGVISEWDPGVNPSAGFSDILESPSDLSDPITGIYGFTNTMILMRQNSIWQVTKQPIETNPFYFYAAFPGIGCDCPSTIAVVPNGLAWLDIRTGTVWVYTPGSPPVPIGRPVEANIIKGVDDPKLCFGSYNGKNAEYTVAIPRASSTLVTTWTYNFRTQAWVEGEYDGISSLNDIELSNAGGGLTIDELVGLIDQLLGNIDDLSPSSTTINSRVFGRTDGELVLEDITATTDAGRTFNTEIVSKSFVIPSDDTYVAELRIEFIQRAIGEMRIYQSKDGGDSWILYRTVTPTYLTLEKPQIVKIKKPLKARRYSWKVEADEGLFEIMNFIVRVSAAGESKAP